jgi:hypothetical protein
MFSRLLYFESSSENRKQLLWIKVPLSGTYYFFMALQPFVGPWPLFKFLDHIHSP